MAQIEAMDTLIGQLLEAIPGEDRENTLVIFMGDNGSEQWAEPAPPIDPVRSKTTVYEGGVRVPMVVTGPGVLPGARSSALGNSVDIFPTLVELAGGDPGATGTVIDGVSLVEVLEGGGPHRDWIFADSGWPDNYSYAIRDDNYKLVVRHGREELFDMRSDPWETDNLLEGELDESADTAYDSLKLLSAELLPDPLPEIRR